MKKMRLILVVVATMVIAATAGVARMWHINSVSVTPSCDGWKLEVDATDEGWFLDEGSSPLSGPWDKDGKAAGIVKIKWDTGETASMPWSSSKPKTGCDPKTPPPCEKKGCFAIDPQDLVCITWLASPISQVFDGTKQLRNWWQANDGAKTTIHISNGHLRNSLLHIVLQDGEKLDILMRVGYFVEFKDEQGNQLWFQNGCERRAKGDNGQPKAGVDERFSQAVVNTSEPCVNKEDI